MLEAPEGRRGGLDFLSDQGALVQRFILATVLRPPRCFDRRIAKRIGGPVTVAATGNEPSPAAPRTTRR